MLGSQNIVAFVATQTPDKAKTFYQDTLSLPLLSEDGFALVFDAHGTMLRVSRVENVVIAPYTVLGWQVDDIVATAEALQQKGVTFEHFPGLPQDELGVWNAPGGAKVAWFKDPDGNLLSISQH
ncbi:MAG: VOC family protein [Bryobacteraceae bacterium]|jgi:catechol 2,3-dioxygenase-like lactoylglutathione lyase family enzyme